MTPPVVPPEMPRSQPVGQIGAAGLARDVTASPAECAALATRLAIPAVARLSCRFQLSLAPGGVVLAEGTLSARVTRECVVSLEPFEVEVTDSFRVRFVPESVFDSQEEDSIDPESDDEIPYPGNAIDLGEAAVEQLALALDPYPKMPSAVLEGLADAPPGDGDGTADPARPSPFAVLARRARRE